MDERIVSIQELVNPVLHQAQRLGFATRAIELQSETVELLRRTKGEVSLVKSQFISERNEQAANALLSMELILDALAAEMEMWVAVKGGQMGDAWDYLVDAQSAIAQAIQVHEAAASFLDYARKLGLAERILFPPQKFMSAGMVVRKSECSICGQDYDACDHIKGRAYLGQVCVRVITDVDLEEVSVVDDPANRRCRILTLTDEGGITRDYLTWREVKRPGSETGGYGY